MAKEIKTVLERQIAVRQKRSKANKIYVKFIKNGGIPKPGLGKGMEPKEDWCECHNRVPCPIDEELKKESES